MENKLTLVDFWCSPFGLRVRIALKEKGLQFEYKEEDLGNKSTLLLQMNPVHKKVPVLIHNGRPICESTVILQYIDEVWPDRAPLLPSDPYERSQARFWADFIDKKIYSTGRQVWSSTGEEQEEAKKELLNCFKMLESQLGDGPYFGGTAFGLVDVSLIPFYTWFYTLEKTANVCLTEKCPKLVTWTKKCMERDSVAQSLPDQHKVHEFLMYLKDKSHK